MKPEYKHNVQSFTLNGFPLEETEPFSGLRSYSGLIRFM